MILTLITVGKYLESRSKGKTSEAIEKLMDLAPKQAKVLRDGKEVTVPAEELVKVIWCWFVPVKPFRWTE